MTQWSQPLTTLPNAPTQPQLDPNSTSLLTFSVNMASSTEATESRPASDITESEAEIGPNMINLTTHMTIAPGTKCLVTCRFDIKIEVSGGAYILVSAPNPTEIAAPVPMLLSPTEKLGSDFAHGWANIPDEIRINIMGCVMSSTSSIRWIRAVALSSSARPGDFTMGRNLRGYLGMDGELACLAGEASTSTTRSPLMLRSIRGFDHAACATSTVCASAHQVDSTESHFPP